MITLNLVIYPALNPVRICGKYPNYKARRECFILSPLMKPKKLSIVHLSPKKQSHVSKPMQSPKKANTVSAVKYSKKANTFVKHDKPKDQENAIYCTKCNLIVQSIKELQNHKSTCFKGRRYHCTDKKYDKSFLHISIMLQHVAGVHKNNPFVCSICKEMFIFKKVMDAHIKCEHAVKILCTSTCVPNVVRGSIIKHIIKSMQITIIT